MTDHRQGAPPAPLRSRSSAIVQALVQALWLYAIPAQLAAVWLLFFVPAMGRGLEIWVMRAAQYPVAMLSALFLIFSGLAHYWRFHLAGGRHASALPAHVAPDEHDPDRLREWASLASTYESLRFMRQRLFRRIDETARQAVDQSMNDARSALLSGDLMRSRQATQAAKEPFARLHSERSFSPLLRTAGTIALIVVLAWACRDRVVAPYEVSSRSMLPTLEQGDRLAVNKLAYRSPLGTSQRLPARGDAIVFRSSAAALGVGTWPDVLVKRVIGLPGDRIEMDGGIPVINGWRVPSCDAGSYLHIDATGEMLQGHLRVEFIENRAYLTAHSFPMRAMPDAYVVAPNEVFVLGDNRVNSLDSRWWNGGRGGGVRMSAIEGRAEWFLVGTRNGGGGDFTRFLRSIDTMQGRLRVEGVDATALEEGIARCLRERPKDTVPPGPESMQTAQAGRP